MRGVLLELINFSSLRPELRQSYDKMFPVRPTKVIVLRELDADKYLVAICRPEVRRNWIPILSSEGVVFANIMSFYAVHKAICKGSNVFFSDPENVVDMIYSKHEIWLEEIRKVQKQKKKKVKRGAPRIESLTIKKKGQPIEVPPNLQWSVRHPYKGGDFSGN